ncbi:MAG: hypothetical protein IRY87_28385 [Acetobacteraceae bacterium]|nr:hypothetical protein [Acetobacteraceae bacterium]
MTALHAAGRGGNALALIGLVREAVASGIPRQALHLRLARLAPRLRRGHHHRLVQEALEPVLRPSRARLFDLPNGDLVVVAPPDSPHLKEVEAALLTLLPLETAESALALLRLPEEAAALLAAVEAALVPGPEGPPGAPEEGARFTAARLGMLERALGGVGLAAFLRHRPVCRLRSGDERPEVEFLDLRIALPELGVALGASADPATAPWLRRRLRRLLDRRLLAELARPEEARRLGPVGLCLSVASLTSAEFLRFEKVLGAAGRVQAVIGLLPEDILAEPEEFAFARDFCRARGFRLALEADSAPPLPLDRLGLDLLRLRWSPDLPRLGESLRATLPEDRERVVLTGADGAGAIGWGWEEGITLFEGRLLRPKGPSA